MTAVKVIPVLSGSRALILLIEDRNNECMLYKHCWEHVCFATYTHYCESKHEIQHMPYYNCRTRINVHDTGHMGHTNKRSQYDCAPVSSTLIFFGGVPTTNDDDSDDDVTAAAAAAVPPIAVGG